jgi:glyceraldehyde-3-phosphate dehydrogenase (NADP+)
MTPKPFLVNGDWISTSRSCEVRDPFVQKVIGAYCEAGVDEVERAFATADQAFQANRSTTPASRAKVLDRVAALVEKRSAEFVDTLVQEAGKPVTLAEVEIARAQQTFLFAAAECRQAQGEMLALDGSDWGKSHFGVVRDFPLGVILGITPFNFPVNLVAHKIAPAFASGNAIIIKPSPRTVFAALLLGEVLHEAGVPPGLVNIVPFGVELLEPYYTDPRVKMVSFTGSAAVGWKIKERCNTKKVCLELGGNAALVVHDDADWAAKIPAIANGAFGYAGQSCISVQRIFVQHRIYESFRDSLVEYVRTKVKSGDPRDREVVVGPMIAADAVKRVRHWIDDAREAGAKVAVEPTVEGQCLGPSVLEQVPDTQPISCEEAFAPVAVLDAYETFEDAIAKVNASRWGMQTGVLTRDIKLAYQAFEQLEVAGVLVNQLPTFRVENMPYGGIKMSGFGREGVRYAMKEMTEPKSLAINLG